MNKYWTFGIGALIGLALALGAGWYALNSAYTYHGVVIDPPAPAFDITLTDQHGQPYRLSEQQGKLVLIFFGYTHCPDVCPVTLSEYRQIKRMLGEQAKNVQFVYITVDPQRDTPERIGQYLQNFDPEFVGLSGSAEALAAVWKAYGVYQQPKESNSAGGYLVDHSSRTYLIDAQGHWRMNYNYGTDSENIAKDLLHLIKNNDG